MDEVERTVALILTRVPRRGGRRSCRSLACRRRAVRAPDYGSVSTAFRPSEILNFARNALTRCDELNWRTSRDPVKMAPRRPDVSRRSTCSERCPDGIPSSRRAQSTSIGRRRRADDMGTATGAARAAPAFRSDRSGANGMARGRQERGQDRDVESRSCAGTPGRGDDGESPPDPRSLRSWRAGADRRRLESSDQPSRRRRQHPVVWLRRPDPKRGAGEKAGRGLTERPDEVPPARQSDAQRTKSPTPARTIRPPDERVGRAEPAGTVRADPKRETTRTRLTHSIAANPRKESRGPLPPGRGKRQHGGREERGRLEAVASVLDVDRESVRRDRRSGRRPARSPSHSDPRRDAGDRGRERHDDMVVHRMQGR